MWNTKTEVLCFIIGATGNISKSIIGTTGNISKSNTWGNLNHPKIIRKISEQHNGKAGNEGTTADATFGTVHIFWTVLV
jgi:hypothetical protein